MGNKIVSKQLNNDDKKAIIEQLMQLGYEKAAIELAMTAVNNPNDINSIVDRLERDNTANAFDIDLTQQETE